MTSVAYPSLVPASSSLSYATLNNSPVVNAVIKSSMEHHQGRASLQGQVSQLESENQLLQRRLTGKSQENGKLQLRAEKVEGELNEYKQMLSQIQNSIAQGANSHTINLAMTSLKSKSKKVAKPKSNGHSASGNCQCCCEAEKPFICDWPNCGKRFRQKPHLEAHRNIHTGRRFICEWNNCGKSFVRKYNLVEHQKLHSSVNPNMCTYPDCGKVFSSKYSLVRHQNAQHNLAL